MKKFIIAASLVCLAVVLFAFNYQSPQRATTYEVIYSENFNSFQRMVSTRLANGWSLAGGVSMDSVYYMQAICK